MGVRAPSYEPRPEATAAAALRAFVRIAGQWGLSVEQQLTLLGAPARSTYYHWKGQDPLVLPQDTLERISYVLGIFRALQILLPDPERADGWVRRPNDAPLFGGASALDRMLGGQVADLFVVRQYLDAELGGWP
ncbi:MAG TPA: MbcA/ParS/Xre antitoxin family protein [Longimicrobiales bacterium]|nr:MbcA/ParS/Xre antitoxin family protein [Longimicrobiales bacterium]